MRAAMEGIGNAHHHLLPRWDKSATTTLFHIDALCRKGEIDKALDFALHHMPMCSNTTDYNKVCLSLLKACHKARSFPHVKTLYDHLTLHRQSDVIESLKIDLVITLAKCGALNDAHQLLLSMPHRTVHAWTALIAGYSEHGQGQVALRLYSLMVGEGIKPDEYTYVALFKACGSIPDLEKGLHFHTLARREGFSSFTFVGNTLIGMYGKCGSVEEAENIFYCVIEHDIVSWNAMLSVFVESHHGEKTMRLYRQLVEEGNVSPNIRTVLCVVQACSILARSDEKNTTTLVEIALALHADARKKGFVSDVYIGSALQSMYGKFGMVREAEKVFAGMSCRNVVTWNAMLSAYVEGGEGNKALQLYNCMLDKGESPNHQTFAIALQACSVLTENEEAFAVEAQTIKVIPLKIGQALHQDASKTKGFSSNSFLLNALVSMYGRCGSLADAETVFKSSLSFGVVAYNAMLSAYVVLGQGDRALKLYRQAQEERAQLDNFTFVIALQACGTLAESEGSFFVKGEAVRVVALEVGRALHADAKRNGFLSHTFFENTLISMYGKCGSITYAASVFNQCTDRNTVTWNAMLSVYVDQNEGGKALQLYRQMHMEGQSPNKLTYVLVLQACGALAESQDDFVQEAPLEISKTLHALVKEKGFIADVYVGCTLISMYGKCGTLKAAEAIFDEMSAYHVVPWNALLSAHIEQDQGDKVLDLYRDMQAIYVTATNITLMCVLQACGSTGCLEISRQVHFSVLCSGCDNCPIMVNTVVFAYRSCASIADALEVFGGLPRPPAVSWNACIAGYAHEGNCDASVHFFERMQLAGDKPDEVTSLSLLTAYSHAGLVDEGFEYFESLCRVHGITPDVKHYSILIDLIGRAGKLKVVDNMIQRMPVRANYSIWLSVLGACRTHGDVRLGKLAFDNAVQLHPMGTSQYILLINIYADAGLHEQAKELESFTFHFVNKAKESDGISIDVEDEWQSSLCTGAATHYLSECYEVG
ncbi:hypothetical protein L7F22_058129 [Adiantum nelumboides]|nr:hypothetical protein [Adiantum nelumboides]